MDALGGPFVGQRLGQLRHPAFGRRIGRYQPSALKRKQRRDIDDLAAPLREHVAPAHLAEPEYGIEIDLDGTGPVLRRVSYRRSAADNARVVHQYIDRTQFSNRQSNQGLARLRIRKVARTVDGPDAGLGDIGRDIFEAMAVTAMN